MTKKSVMAMLHGHFGMSTTVHDAEKERETRSAALESVCGRERERERKSAHISETGMAPLHFNLRRFRVTLSVTLHLNLSRQQKFCQRQVCRPLSP